MEDTNFRYTHVDGRDQFERHGHRWKRPVWETRTQLHEKIILKCILTQCVNVTSLWSQYVMYSEYRECRGMSSPVKRLSDFQQEHDGTSRLNVQVCSFLFRSSWVRNSAQRAAVLRLVTFVPAQSIRIVTELYFDSFLPHPSHWFS
jgi:hypothetical protein